ncbi:unnamed protein product [Arctia plantaginis]|uniref:FLYWCH-type domain-containing protein n=1 Tax=Arctia plantaginis TaxID=874455 RepID=A0A8S1AQ46_ARCPL|nr:unnamed protein product [Arctia plantaginis]CAB3250374.1 unnamed protein product [Arctia plantaginis]
MLKSVQRITIANGLPLKFLLSRYGKPALEYRGFRFNQRLGSSGGRARWVCVRVAVGCKARIYTFGYIDCKFERTRFGNPVIVVGKYRYNKWSGSKGAQVRWTCVKNQQGCRATITTIDNVIIRTKNYHTHL